LRERPASRLLLIGLDAGDLAFLRARSGALPTFGRLLGSGRLFETRSPKALSGAVWPTFYTGHHPGEHGIYQHLLWDPARMGLRRIGPDWCLRRPFWADLEARGERVAVLDVPYSFPVTLQRGVEITDWATHGQTHPFACNHPHVASQIRRQFGRSPIGRETPVAKTPAQLARVRRCLIESAARKAELTSELMRELEWDVFIAVFGELHRAGHTLFSALDEPDAGDVESPLLDVYRAVDRALARILKSVDLERTTVLLFSVHGMARDKSQAHAVRPLMDRLNERFLEHNFGEAHLRRRRRGLIRGLRGRAPVRLQHAVGAVAPDAVRRWVVEQEIVGGLHWPRTPGFALRTDIRTELRLNLKGREAMGMLEPGSCLHHRYLEWLRKAIEPLCDAQSGAPLVDEVVGVHELFPGAHADGLPDLVLTWRDEPPARRLASPTLGQLEVTPHVARGGDHTDVGFGLLFGARANAEGLPPLAETTDFASFVRNLSERGRL